MKLTIILAEHGKPAPDVTQYRECWPNAEIQVYTDLPDTLDLVPGHPRYGWRMNDFWKVSMLRSALVSGADVAMCFDADMRIVDREAARQLPMLAAKFGVCLPMNPRYTVRRDAIDGADVSLLGRAHLEDRGLWHGPSVNCSPIAVANDLPSLQMVTAYCNEMRADPIRGPLAWWKAMLSTGITPLILPPQWCVCEVHRGIESPIIIHEGHESVKRYYADVKCKG